MYSINRHKRHKWPHRKRPTQLYRISKVKIHERPTRRLHAGKTHKVTRHRYVYRHPNLVYVSTPVFRCDITSLHEDGPGIRDGQIMLRNILSRMKHSFRLYAHPALRQGRNFICEWLAIMLVAQLIETKGRYLLDEASRLAGKTISRLPLAFSDTAPSLIFDGLGANAAMAVEQSGDRSMNSTITNLESLIRFITNN